MKRAASTFFAAAIVALGLPATVSAQSWSDQPVDVAADHPQVAVAYDDGGRYYTEDDVPTFNVGEDGSVDWLTFSGFRRYHSECHVCHGPDGEGSTYAPKIKNSAVNMDYYDFVDTVVNGRANGNSVMPHFGDNQNVMCYLDDIYVYLKARGMEAISRGRPAKKEAKSDLIQENENACMGS
ncbi:c-type cytochrome, methanol metabolism-related [Puniceibacterium confluentis]|uniref:c-type cytochrome, methanol metabolism-related n=1 Tax=Puniceibacterium confluentis TaxID=1958944 RepID=UPI0011B5C025|nr:c-type cytochrome, methanol metabolism-related [Puniceibacterium confluentis]